MSNDQSTEEKVQRPRTTEGRARRSLESILNVRGHKVLLVELPQMNRVTVWKWHSGSGREAIFEQVEQP